MDAAMTHTDPAGINVNANPHCWRVTVTDGFHPHTEAIEVWHDEFGSIALWIKDTDADPVPLFDMQRPHEAAVLARVLIEAAARAIGLPERQLTFLRRELDNLEGLANR
jgi:hypothetical protein